MIRVTSALLLTLIGATSAQFGSSLEVGPRAPYPVLNAQAFGVRCDGQTDTTAALQIFLNALGAQQGQPGLQGILPSGKCLFSQTLTLPAFDYQLTGAGMYATVLTYQGASTTADLLYVDGSSAVAPIGAARLTNFRLSSTTVMTGGAALHVHDASRVSTDHVALDGADGNGFLWNGIWLDQTDLQFVQNFEMRAQNDCFLVSANGAGNPGVQYDLFARDGKVAGCGHAGVHMAGGFDNAHFDAMELTNNGVNVIIDNALNSGKNQEVFFGPGFVSDQTLTGDGFYINDTSTNCANYCNIDIRATQTAAHLNGVNVHAYPAGFVTVAGAMSQSNGLAGVSVDDATATVIVAPQTVLHGNATWGIYCSVATSNIVYGGTARSNTSGSYSANCAVQTH